LSDGDIAEIGKNLFRLLVLVDPANNAVNHDRDQPAQRLIERTSSRAFFSLQKTSARFRKGMKH